MKSSLTDLLPELRQDIASARAVNALSAGAIAGLGLLIAQIAFATFIFSGHLAPYASQGVGLILFGNVAACLIIALAGGYRGVIAGLSPALVIGMALIASSMDARGDALFISVSVALVLGAVLTGACILMLGRLGLANLMRFIPYPVAAGFVAGIGGAVCLAAMSLMDAEPSWRTIPTLLEPAVFWRWVPGVAYGIALYWAMKRWGHPLILPISVAIAVAAYHLALGALDVSGAEARETGLLLTGTADGNLWPVLFPADLVRVDWIAVAMQGPNMLALMLVAFIAIVMNIAGLEVAVNQDLDWDREFRAGGFASIVAGLGGATVATIVVPASLRSKLFAADTRLTGIVAALVIAGALFLGDGLLELVPSPLVGGILVFAGLGMLDEGLVRSYRRLPGSEFGITVLIAVAIVAFGLPEGIGGGMLVTLVFFAVRLSRVDPIESHFTAHEGRSNKTRPVPDRAILLEEGQRIHAYRLRGYIFFGSVSPLVDRIRESLDREHSPACLMLDFAGVSGFDYSAVNVLSRLLQAAQGAGARVVLSASPERLTREFERNLPNDAFAGLFIEPDADRALERCEEVILAAWKANTETQRVSLLDQVEEDLERYLARQIDFEDLVEELRDWLDPREYAAAESIAGSPAARDGPQLLLSGRASAYGATGTRLYQCGPGDVLWPAGAAGEHVTSLVAEEACRTLLMTPAARRWLETHRKDLALKFYGYVFASRLQAAPANDSGELST